MPYRSTKEKAEAQKVARKLYVKDGLSLKEIHQQTGTTLRTLRSWCNLGDWDGLRPNTELDRLERLRDSLLDKAEAQIKEGKLPHTELGLVYKLERLIIQREKKKEKVTIILDNTLQYLTLYLIEHDLDLMQVFGEHFKEFVGWIAEQDLTRPPEETSRLGHDFISQRQEFARRRQGAPPLQR